MLKVILPTIPMFMCLFWGITLWAGFFPKHRAKLFLGIFMLLNALLYFAHFCFFNCERSFYRILDPFYTLISIAGYPLYYLYIRLLTKDVHLKLKQLWVLIPAVLMGISKAIVKWDTYDNYANTTSSYTDWNKILQVIFIIIYVSQLPFVVYASRKLIVNYNKRLKHFYAEITGKMMHTTVRVLYILIIFSLISAVLSVMGRQFFEKETILLIFPSLTFSVLMWWIGWVGFNQNFNIQDFQKEIDKYEKDKVKHEKDTKQANNKDSNYKTTLEAPLRKLLEEDKVFTNKDISLSKVAEMLNTNRSYLSNFINTDLGCSFNSLINRYRIEYAKQLLQENTNNALSISEIGYNAGYYSDSSFFRIFKQQVGVSPKTYMQQQLQSKK